MVSITFVDLGIVPVEGAEYISNITWVTENNMELLPRHYFVDYPGAKSLERQVTNIVGGSPLTRYSLNVVLRTLIEDTPTIKVIACKDERQKQLLKTLIKTLNIKTSKVFITFQDVIDKSDTPSNMIGFISLVSTHLEAAKNKASSTFGNAL